MPDSRASAKRALSEEERLACALLPDLIERFDGDGPLLCAVLIEALALYCSASSDPAAARSVIKATVVQRLAWNGADAGHA